MEKALTLYNDMKIVRRYQEKISHTIFLNDLLFSFSFCIKGDTALYKELWLFLLLHLSCKRLLLLEVSSFLSWIFGIGIPSPVICF